MLIGSFEPPPVKMVAFRFPQPKPDVATPFTTGQSPVQDTEVAPVVFEDVPQPAFPVTWWQTRSQSSAGPSGAAAFAETAFPSSSNAPVSCTASAPGM